MPSTHRKATPLVVCISAAAIVAVIAGVLVSCGSSSSASFDNGVGPVGFGGGSAGGSASGPGFGGSASGPIGLGLGFACMTSATCLPGEVCCAPVSEAADASFLTGSSCLAGRCPEIGDIQLCGRSAECLAPGFTCGPPSPPLVGMAGVITGVMICEARMDAGVDADGGSGDDASPSEESGNDDAPSGDGTPRTEGGSGDGSDAFP